MLTDRGIEVAADVRQMAGVAHRHDQNRDRFAIGLGDAAIGVLCARPMLHAKYAKLAPGGDARDGVRHVQPGAFLPHNDRTDAGGGAALQDVVDGIANHPFDLFAL